MPRVKIYGIPNCDTVKKAQAFLKAHNILYDFHDYKQNGITKEKITTWLALQPAEVLLNKKSTAWKILSAEEKSLSVTDSGTADLMMAYPNLIKRPVTEISGTILIGFSEITYSKVLNLL